MQLKIGSYTHPVGEPNLSITRRPILTEGGVPLSLIHTWTIEGLITGDGQASIDAKIAELLTAYSQAGFDAILLLDSGQPSRHAIYNSQTIGGIQITEGPSFPEGGGAEYATKRTFTVTLEAEVPLSVENDLISFRESVAVWGGGPRTVLTETKLGPPRSQQVRRQTIYYASQSGSATGYRRQPSFPGLLFPSSHLVEPPKITHTGGRHRGGGKFTDFVTTWEVQYQSDRPLIGRPNTQ